MVVSISHHASERIWERFSNDPCFEIKFRWTLKQIKRGIVKEYKWKRPGTMEVIYDRVKFIYQKVGNSRKLITTYSC